MNYLLHSTPPMDRFPKKDFIASNFPIQTFRSIHMQKKIGLSDYMLLNTCPINN